MNEFSVLHFFYIAFYKQNIILSFRINYYLFCLWAYVYNHILLRVYAKIWKLRFEYMTCTWIYPPLQYTTSSKIKKLCISIIKKKYIYI